MIFFFPRSKSYLTHSWGEGFVPFSSISSKLVQIRSYCKWASVKKWRFFFVEQCSSFVDQLWLTAIEWRHFRIINISQEVNSLVKISLKIICINLLCGFHMLNKKKKKYWTKCSYPHTHTFFLSKLWWMMKSIYLTTLEYKKKHGSKWNISLDSKLILTE